jgi:hypothetical protein
MTKHPRNHTLWTNAEIEEDAQGYLRAQAAYDADQAKEQDRRREQADREHFVAEFVASGGTKAGAEARWQQRKNERAAAAAETADEQARRAASAAAMGSL